MKLNSENMSKQRNKKIKLWVVISIILIAEIPTYSKQCVILLHGLARSAKSMQKLSDNYPDRGGVIDRSIG
jgi:hypothetical protein